MEYEELIN